MIELGNIFNRKLFQTVGITEAGLTAAQRLDAIDLVTKHGANLKVFRALAKFINNNVCDFSIRFEKMTRLHNGSKEYFQLSYGANWEEAFKQYLGPRIHEAKKTKTGRSDIFGSQLGYWISRGFDEPTAMIKLAEFQKKASIAGKDVAREARKKWRETKIKSGEWENTCRNKGNSLDVLVEKLGLMLGTKRYLELCEKSKNRNSLVDFQNRHGVIVGTKRHTTYVKKLAMTVNNCKRRYGEVEGEAKYKEWREKIAKALTVDGYIERYGEDEGITRYVTDNSNRAVGLSKASNESRIVLDPIYTMAKTNGFSPYYGIAGCKEYFISLPGGEFFLYDFVVKERKLVVEYHGAWIHPRPEKMAITEWESWRNPYNGNTASFQYAREMRKKDAAILGGFRYIEIWSDSDNTESLQIITDILNGN